MKRKNISILAGVLVYIFLTSPSSEVDAQDRPHRQTADSLQTIQTPGRNAKEVRADNTQPRHRSPEQFTGKSDVRDAIPVAGSTGRVGEDQMNKGLVSTPLDALKGQTAGLTISPDNSDPLAILNSVRVRGTTSLTGGNNPLVIIDGVSSDLATLSTIFPSDIESFTILKNAAETVKYGSRGASGVIVVTTRKGSGRNFRIGYDGNFGVRAIYKTLPMLDAQEYAATASRLGIPYNDGGQDTDFQKSITRAGLVQNHHVAFSNGTDQTSWRASLGYTDQQQVIKGKGYSNLMAKVDVTQKAFGDIFTGELGMFGSSTKDEGIFDTQMLFYSAATQNPTFSAGREADGNWRKNSTASQINPPGALLYELNDARNLHFNAHTKLDFKIMQGLNLTLSGSYSFSSAETGQFCPTWVWAQGQAYRNESKNENWLGNISLSYSRTWGRHSLKASLLGEYLNDTSTGFYTQVNGFTSNDFGYDNLDAAAIRYNGKTGSSKAVTALTSFMASAEYSFAGRYTLTVTTRADGSSLVGKNHRWGFFPSVSGIWDIRKETFMEDVHEISLMKLRAGYGISGNLGGISPYSTIAAYIPNGTVSYNGSPTVTMGILRNTNPDLKWETRSTFNIGTDMGFIDNRIVMTLEYYYSLTKDMLYLYDVPVPPFTYDKLLANLGSMSNSGIEAGLMLTPVKKKDMELNIGMNLSWQRNILLSLSGVYAGMHLSAADITSIGALNGAGFHGGNSSILYQIVGQPLGVFYLPHCTGLAAGSDGTLHYEVADIDGKDGIDLSDGGDRYIAGQAAPKVILGSNIAFRYKWFDLSLQINGAFGHKIYNGTSLSYMNMSGFPAYNVMRGAPEKNIVDQNATDYWLEKGDYVNIDYLTVGCNVPLKSNVIKLLRLSLSVNNIATITGYSGLTPMINSTVFNSTMGIDDKRSYPLYRTYSIGAGIQF